MSKKRLLFTVSNDLSHDQRMIRICHTLAMAGYDVQLIGREKKFSTPLLPQIFRQKRLSVWAQKGKLFYLELNMRLFFYLLFRRFDAVCAVDLDTILPVCWVGRLRRRPFVYDAHEYFTQTPEVVRRPSIQRIWAWVARQTIQHSAARYTVGAALADVMGKEYSIDFEVIRNVPFHQPNNNGIANERTTDKKIILYQGALNEGRGLEMLLDVLPALDKTVELWLCGEGDVKEKLSWMTDYLYLDERVTFFGWVAPDALKRLTEQAYIGVNLLENNGLSYYYSLANKFFDYVQAQIPQLTMAFPEYVALNQVYEVAALIGDVHDRQQLLNTIEHLLNDSTYYNNLQHNAQIAAQEWIWQAETPRLLAIYAHLFEKHQ